MHNICNVETNPLNSYYNHKLLNKKSLNTKGGS